MATIQGWCLFLWQAHRHQEQLDKVCMSNTVMLLDAFSGIYATSCHQKLFTHMCACAVYISRSYYLRVVFISFRVYNCAVTIQEWQLFKEMH